MKQDEIGSALRQIFEGKSDAFRQAYVPEPGACVRLRELADYLVPFCARKGYRCLFSSEEASGDVTIRILAVVLDIYGAEPGEFFREIGRADALDISGGDGDELALALTVRNVWKARRP